LRKKAPDRGAALRRVILPLAGCIVVLAAVMGYYFWRVTGNPFRMPYQVDRSTYARAPYFPWQQPNPTPVYRQDALRDFYNGAEFNFYAQHRSGSGILVVEAVKLAEIWLFYLGPALTLPLIFCFAAAPYGASWRGLSSELRFLLIALAVLLAGFAIEVFPFPHYVAPITGLLYGLVLMAMQAVWRWEWTARPVGRFLARAVPAICILTFVVRAGAAPLRLTLGADWPPSWYNAKPTYSERARLQDQLKALPGNQLVFVRYAPGYADASGYAWVYNDADIDGSKVVWAWDLGEAENRSLIEYFKGRQLWIVRLDNLPLKLESYPPES
jgi:hypothetical protein